MKWPMGLHPGPNGAGRSQRSGCRPDRGDGRGMTERPLLGAAEFPGDIEHVTEARHWVRKVLGDDHVAVDLVELLACELITNSAKHTKTDKVRIAVYGSDDIVHVKV